MYACTHSLTRAPAERERERERCHLLISSDGTSTSSLYSSDRVADGGAGSAKPPLFDAPPVEVGPEVDPLLAGVPVRCVDE